MTDEPDILDEYLLDATFDEADEYIAREINQFPSDFLFDFESAYFGLPQAYISYEDHLLKIEWKTELAWPGFVQSRQEIQKQLLHPVISAKSYSFMRALAFKAYQIALGLKRNINVHKTNQKYCFLKKAIEYDLTGSLSYYRQLSVLTHYIQDFPNRIIPIYTSPESLLSFEKIPKEDIWEFIYACRTGDEETYIAKLNIILDKRNQIEGIDNPNEEIRSAGYFYYKYLITQGLGEALFHRHLSIAKDIVAKGLYPGPEPMFRFDRDIWPANKSYQLHRQIEHESAAGKPMDERGIAFWLEQGEDINEINLFSRTPLDLAIERGHLAAIEYLRKKGAKTFLEIANKIVFRTDEEIIKLAENHPDPDWRWYYRSHSLYHLSLCEASVPWSAQEMAAKPFAYPLPEDFLQACASGDKDAVQARINKGLDLIFAQDALELAIKAASFEIICLIIQNGLHVSLLRPHLLKLVSGHYSYLPFLDQWLEVMVKQGTAVNFYDLFSDPVRTPLDYALEAQNNAWVTLLKLSGAKTFQEILTMELD